MAYDPTVWKSGDTITSAKLNKLENGLAEASGGGTGGGALIVNYNEDGFDKTWQECADAIDAGIIVLVLYNSEATKHMYKILCGWSSKKGYVLFSVDNYSNPYAIADTANDYPVEYRD